MKKQKTLAGSAQFSGVALHTGVRATLKIVPAPENTGILFRRVDLPDKPVIPAAAQCVVDVQRGTTIAVSKTAIVYTVEHILSALHAWGITNCIVEMDGLEPPIADGSSMPYYNMIAEAGGAVEQQGEIRSFTPPHPIWIEGGMLMGQGECNELCDRYAEYVRAYNAMTPQEKTKLRDDKFKARKFEVPKQNLFERLFCGFCG